VTNSWTKGSSRAWRQVRLFVLNRDGYLCQLRLSCCTGLATEAHHVLGRQITGDDPQFIVASCKRCNLRVGTPSGHADPAHTARTSW
jgi:5-methylcytosine-specific restriction endonuclease McrA